MNTFSKSNELPDVAYLWAGLVFWLFFILWWWLFGFFCLFGFFLGEDYLLALSLPISYHWLAKQIILFQKVIFMKPECIFSKEVHNIKEE